MYDSKCTFYHNKTNNFLTERPKPPDDEQNDKKAVQKWWTKIRADIYRNRIQNSVLGLL